MIINKFQTLYNLSSYDSNVTSVEILYALFNNCSNVILPVKVVAITDDQSLGGKFPENSQIFDAVLNMDTFLFSLFAHLPSKLNKLFLSNVSQNISISENFNIYDHTSSVYFSMGKSRVQKYLYIDYNIIQKTIIEFSSNIAYILGFTEIKLYLDILSDLETKKNTIMMLGIILDLIIFILIILSIMLLYSLLVIAIETKTFTLGVLRMLGMNRKSLIILLISQSLSYSLPAYVVGIVVAQIFAVVVLTMLGTSGNIDLDKKLTEKAVVIATVIGIGCSLVAAILPIMAALKENLREALDVRHSKTKAIKFEIERAGDLGQFSWNVFWVSLVMVLYGCAIQNIFIFAQFCIF